MRPMKVRGRPRVLVDSDGRLYDDIDTDQIYHNRHLHVTEVGEMGQHALGNLIGWEGFPSTVCQSDIVVAGRNFGSGSSRQHAVDCFIALGVAAIVAESFGAIYKRNAINSGFAIVEVQGLRDVTAVLTECEWMEIDLGSSVIQTSLALDLRVRPVPQVQKDIYLAGDLFAYGRSLMSAKKPHRRLAGPR